MHLKLEELQRVAKETIKEEQSHKSLREELFRVLGPPVMVSKNYEKVAVAANEQLDLLESFNRPVDRGAFKVSVLIEASRSKSSSVRKIAARLLPEKIASRLLSDPSSSVRCAAAKRSSYALVKEAIKRFPTDDQLRTIAKAKKIQEAGLPDAVRIDEPFDMYGDGPLGDAVKQKKGGDLPDTWYQRLAAKLCAEYGSNLEGQWEEILASRVVASHFSTTGVRLDRDKLLNAIHDCIKEREDEVLGEGSLKSIAARLLKESYLDDAVMPILDEERNDPVADLLESNYSTAQYVEAAEKIFSIRKSVVPSGIKKYRLGEGSHVETMIPVNGKIPGDRMNSTSEEALDRYVDSWNKRQAISGEPYRLSWGPHGSGINMVGFHLQLK